MAPDRQHWLITIDIRFRLLRVAYQWKSFLMEGILSMYHTCGNRLPLTLIHVSSNTFVITKTFHTMYTQLQLKTRYICSLLLQDVEEHEVDNFLPVSCQLLARVNLKIPIHGPNILNNTSYRNTQAITSILITNFNRNQFKYDATWFTKQFHNLDAIWLIQKNILRNKISTIVKSALSTAINDIEVANWMTKKFAILQEQIGAIATDLTSEMPSNVDSTTTSIQRGYNIDSGLLED